MTILLTEINDLIEETDKLKSHTYSILDKVKRRYNLAKKIYKDQGILKTADYAARQIGRVPYGLAHILSKGQIGNTMNELRPIDLSKTKPRVINRARDFANRDSAKVQAQNPDLTRPTKFSDIEALRYERNRLKNLNLNEAERTKKIQDFAEQLKQQREKLKTIKDPAEKTRMETEINGLQKKHDRELHSFESTKKRALNDLGSNPTYGRVTPKAVNNAKSIQRNIGIAGSLGALYLGNKVLNPFS
jgi:hypothetical protein